MQRLLRLCFLLLPLTLFSQNPITLEDIWQNGTFGSKGVPGFNFQKDGVHFTKLSGASIEQYDLRTGDRSGIIFDAASVTDFDPGWKGTFDGYSFSADETSLLLSTNTEPIYRWSKKADHFVFNSKTKKLTALYPGAKQRYATFSPDGSKVAFVVENDLYYKDLNSGKTTRISADGTINEIINGASDWVYEEEFEIIRAFEWSPDGAKIAFLRFDEREVPEMSMEMYRGGEYPELVKFKYPKVGEKNAVATAHIYDLASAKTIGVDIPDREKNAADGRLDDYLPRIAWTPQKQLCLTWMNRHQNHRKLLLADPANGKCSVLLEEKNKYYIDLHDVTFLSDGSGFVLQSEKSGFNHLYQYDMTGKETAAITKGNWDVTDFYGVDEKNGLVYFQAAAENPMQREIYSVKTGGKGQKKISKEEGTNSAQFSSTFDYFVNTFSSLNSPPRYAVCDRKGKIVRELEQNKELAAKQQDYGTMPVDFFKVPVKYEDSANGPAWEGTLNGWMIKPTAPQFQNRKLPVLMFVYGGPGSQQVTDAWKGANYWWFQMLAQQGYVVACVDNRGTGGRGEEFKKMTYKQLGKMETQDQIEAAKYIGKLPFADPARVGIFGWSYGGYMSSLCMLKGKDVFKTGIAVAPVTNWKWYDSIYTERYMQTNKENSEGYEQNSPINFVNELEGNYLLIHGLADDNVHFQHTAEMANQLIAKNKQFDTMIYPNRNHGIGGGNAKIHLYKLMTNFLNEKLKGDTKEPARP
ncbi:MAG: S9 family peptidase [Lewinellaceae bacterium]|nr:S9 family peptidase [Lewinellaceae bacterium]